MIRPTPQNLSPSPPARPTPRATAPAAGHRHPRIQTSGPPVRSAHAHQGISTLPPSTTRPKSGKVPLTFTTPRRPERAAMTELNGRRVYTRAELTALHGISDSTLQSWERHRDTTGYPEPVGTINRGKGVRPPLAWDAEEWNTWYSQRLTDTRNHSGNRAGHADDLVTLSEAARILGVEPTSITMYPKRPPTGWPKPITEEELPSGRMRRSYRRGDIWTYRDTMHLTYTARRATQPPPPDTNTPSPRQNTTD